MFDKPKLSEPNDMGFQFGINEALTKYAHDEQVNWGNTLPSLDVTVLEVWKDGNRVSYLLIDEKTNEPIREASGYEACACVLDVLKTLKKIDKK